MTSSDQRNPSPGSSLPGRDRLRGRAYRLRRPRAAEDEVPESRSQGADPLREAITARLGHRAAVTQVTHGDSLVLVSVQLPDAETSQDSLTLKDCRWSCALSPLSSQMAWS